MKAQISIRKAVDISLDDLDSFLCDSIPGVSYWCNVLHTINDDGLVAGFECELVEDAAPYDVGDVLLIDRSAWIKGLQRAAAGGYDIFGSSNPFDPGEWDFDAGDHDIIVQMATFGDVVFG